MLRDLLEIVQDFIRKLAASRIFALAVIFMCMLGILISKLFHMQIVDGETYLNDYIQKTEKTVTTAGTRGNIYDRSGNVLAYNKLAYSVTIQDTGAYTKHATRNAMLLRLISILEGHGEKVEGKLEITINSEGDMVYTTTSEAARKRFLRDYYGLTSIDQLDDEKGKYPSNVTARELFDKRVESYELNKMKDERGNAIILTDEQALDIINIRYTMSLTAYQKYETTTVASYVSDETVADIMENTAQMEGVAIEESTVRIYNDSIYFAPIIGYTGKVQDDKLEDLKKINPDYQLSDIVGRTGIEETMEADLQGTKGVRTMYVDNVGRIMEITSETEPQAGHDIYLTIDKDLQIGIYNLLEQQLAGILASKLVNVDADALTETDSSKLQIPIKDAYYQLINNSVLSLKQISAEDASDVEKNIYAKFLSSRTQILQNIRYELESEHPTAMQDLPDDMKAYMLYIYNYLSDPTAGIVLKDRIDQNSDEYKAWKDDTTSLRDHLYAGIAGSWVDTTKLEVTSKYSDADDIYQTLVDYTLSKLESDNKFVKLIYRYLINNNTITGKELCLALYTQGVLPYDEQQVQLLTVNGDAYAFAFMVDKISNIEITPAQLALDPCTGSCVVTDVKTGEVRALVTYPSYDNNRLSGTMDTAYYNQLVEDQSLPLYNNATQARKAPGSTFKPISAVAGLEEYVINLGEKITCTGIYDTISPAMKCWVYPGSHGALDVVGGLTNSCNYFFGEVGHRLSIDENGNYNPEKGIATIQKYASMFGLDHKSGIEISENDPMITTEKPEPSSIGQGTNAYSNVQLARYVTAVANRGDVFELSLLDKITDAKGNLIKDCTPELSSHIEIAETTWNAVQAGMRGVISEGSAKNIFKDLEVDIAGKTGTAQEYKGRANHAYFVSYAPYTNPEICVTVNILNGYASSNAATVAKNVYRFYYGYTTLDSILHHGALDVSNVKIGD